MVNKIVAHLYNTVVPLKPLNDMIFIPDKYTAVMRDRMFIPDKCMTVMSDRIFIPDKCTAVMRDRWLSCWQKWPFREMVSVRDNRYDNHKNPWFSHRLAFMRVKSNQIKSFILWSQMHVTKFWHLTTAIWGNQGAWVWGTKYTSRELSSQQFH